VFCALVGDPVVDRIPDLIGDGVGHIYISQT
jgi:hypothetical protein